MEALFPNSLSQVMVPMAVTFICVFLRGLQHKNVIHNLYTHTFILSYFIVAGEMLTIYFVTTKGLVLILPCGTAAAFAMILSMYLHNKMIARRNAKSQSSK